MDDHQRLVTPDQVELEAQGSVSDLASIPDVVDRAIRHATRQVEEYLQRRLIVRERLDLGRNVELDFDYDVSTNDTSYYSYYTGDWPVLEPIEVVPDDYTLEVHPDGRRFFTEWDNFNYAIRQVRYFAGYRREDQTLSDLQQVDGLSALSTEPPVLPAQIRSTTIRIALNRIITMKQGPPGTNGRTLDLGQGQQVRTPSQTQDFIERELHELDKYRSVAW